MYKFLKKKNFKNQELQNSKPDCVDEIYIPSAQEILENTEKGWPIIDPMKILDKIKARSDSGERYAFFYNSTISKESIALFEAKGYRVKTGVSLDKTPYFKICW